MNKNEDVMQSMEETKIPRLSLTAKELSDGAGLIKQYSAEETYPLHTHDFYEIVYISRGKGTHCINDARQILSEGSLVLIRPQDVHSFKALNYFDFVMFSLGFEGKELQRGLKYLGLASTMIDQRKLPTHITLESPFSDFMEKQLETMLMEENGRERKRSFRTILSQVLYLLSWYREENAEKEVLPKWLTDLDAAMSNKENYIAGLPRMLELCGYSQEYMNRMFKKHFKMTPTEYVNTKRMVYAAELLVSRQYEIVDICYMAGFNNLSYFYAVFKKQYGCTPFAFLKSYLREK